jgi:hypothetical protein
MISLRWSYLMAVLLAGSVEPGRAVPQGTSDRAEFVGEYRGVRYTEEHAYGYTFELWRVNGRPVGLWASVEGFPDSFLTARVADLELGPQGMVSFSATFCDLKESFAGVLSERNLKGTVTLSTRKGVFDSKTVDLVRDRTPGIAASLPVAQWTLMIEGRLRRGTADCGPVLAPR